MTSEPAPVLPLLSKTDNTVPSISVFSEAMSIPAFLDLGSFYSLIRKSLALKFSKTFQKIKKILFESLDIFPLD